MDYEVFAYLFYATFLTLCASRSPRLRTVRAIFLATAHEPTRTTIGPRRDVSGRG